MKKFLHAVSLFTVATLLFVFLGCDTEPVSDVIYISPDSVTITKGQAIEFTATGGYEYEWSLGNDALGQLSNRRGVRTVYTSLYEGSEAASGTGSNATTTAADQPMQVLTVRSYMPYGGSTDSNTTARTDNNYSATAEAYIRHM